jgi:hypothetical protein
MSHPLTTITYMLFVLDGDSFNRTGPLLEQFNSIFGQDGLSPVVEVTQELLHLHLLHGVDHHFLADEFLHHQRGLGFQIFLTYPYLFKLAFASRILDVICLPVLVEMQIILHLDLESHKPSHVSDVEVVLHTGDGGRTQLRHTSPHV